MTDTHTTHRHTNDTCTHTDTHDWTNTHTQRTHRSVLGDVIEHMLSRVWAALWSLGLVSQNSTKAHQGQIRATSRPDQGQIRATSTPLPPTQTRFFLSWCVESPSKNWFDFQQGRGPP